MFKKNQSPAETIGDVVFRQIRQDIISGDLLPGSKIKLEQTKERYEISIPSLREILSRLAMENLVVAEGQRGFEVSPVSRQELNELADLRIVLKRMRWDWRSLKGISIGKGVSLQPTTSWQQQSESF